MDQPDRFAPLSHREREVALLIAEGLTDQAIARRLFLSPRTVEGHAEHIRNKAGVDNRAQIVRWVMERQSGDGPPTGEAPMQADTPPSHLPLHLNSFVGRQQDMEGVRRLLQTHRLLTITGPGGCGKTRLAVEAAAEVLHRYPGGQWFVDLGPVDDPNVVARALANELGVTDREGRDPTAAIAARFAAGKRHRRTLVILDNCEHLAARCAEIVDTLLRASPDIEFLCTSREPLHHPAEVVWPLEPLGLPGAAASPEGIAESEAVRLFLDRATMRDPAFEVNDANVADVVELCWRLDGIPLALELAAARVPLMAIRLIAPHLQRGAIPRVHGAPPRQETLSAAIGWSYGLLGQSEREHLRQLAVFRGGFSADAADAVCRDGDASDEAGTLERLALLTDKSLVSTVPPGRERYRLLELIREYLAERLADAGETDAVGLRHFEYFLGLAERADAELRGVQQRAWLRRLTVDHDNLRAALEFSRGQPVERRLALVLALFQFWHLGGHLGEGREWIEEVLRAAQASPSTPLKARVLNAAAGLAWRQGDLLLAREWLTECLKVSRALDAQASIQSSLGNLGIIAAWLGDHEVARTYYADSLQMAREAGVGREVAATLNNRGVLSAYLGEHAAALADLVEALDIFTGIKHNAFTVVALANLGMAALYAGDVDAAAGYYSRSLKLLRPLGARQYLAECLDGVATVAARRGDTDGAHRLAGAAAALRERTGAVPAPWMRRLLEDWVDLGRFGKGWSDGKAMTETDAMMLAAQTLDVLFDETEQEESPDLYAI